MNDETRKQLLGESLAIIEQQFNNGFTRPVQTSVGFIAGCQACGAVQGHAHSPDCQIGRMLSNLSLVMNS